MKLLDNKSNFNSKSINNDIATLIMEVVPQIMSHLRTKMRLNRAPNLSVPQLRTLIYLHRYQQASLSQVADYLGIKLPSMSKLVDALVGRKLVLRQVSSKDRRCIRLRLSTPGTELLMQSWHLTEAELARTLDVLTAEKKMEIIGALQTLRPLFVKNTDLTA